MIRKTDDGNGGIGPIATLRDIGRLLADGIWVPMATVHFAAVSVALLAGGWGLRASAFQYT